MVVRLPPLRERTDEIEALADHFLRQANAANQRRLSGLDPDALLALQRHAWPGNVRELRNVVDRAVVIARGETISLADLPERIRALRAPAVDEAPAEVEAAHHEDPKDEELDFKTRVQRFEAALIRRALHECDFNQSATSRRLHIPLRTLVNKLQQYGIKKG